ncbi:phospholipase D-like domain-containing protein [Rhizobium beringeri]
MRVTEGLLKTLKAHIPKKGDPIRLFLTADVLSFLTVLIDRAETGNGELYLALYGLHDPELIERLTALVKAGKAHVILSTSGSTDLNKKGDPLPRKPVVWDTGNHDARIGLHAAAPSAERMQDRLFNNNSHIGHNKFAVYVEGGVARAVMTGSTNWTETGLCTQSNNVILIEDKNVAARFLAYWKLLRDDPQPVGVPLTVSNHGETAEGFAPSKGVQGTALRQANAAPTGPMKLKDGKTTVEILFSPNTKAPTKNKTSPTPVDLSRVYSLMEHADSAILFLYLLSWCARRTERHRPGSGACRQAAGPARPGRDQQSGRHCRRQDPVNPQPMSISRMARSGTCRSGRSGGRTAIPAVSSWCAQRPSPPSSAIFVPNC